MHKSPPQMWRELSAQRRHRPDTPYPCINQGLHPQKAALCPHGIHKVDSSRQAGHLTLSMSSARDQGHEGAVHELLGGCSPEVVAAADTNGRTALHWAALQGHQTVVGAIKARHLHLTASLCLQEDLSACTPVGIAAMYGRPGIVSQFVEAVRLASGEQAGREAVQHAANAARTGGVLELAEALSAQAAKWRPAHPSSILCTSAVLRMSTDGGPNLEGSSVFLPLPAPSPILKPHTGFAGHVQGGALAEKQEILSTDSTLVQEAFVDLRFAQQKGMPKDFLDRGEGLLRQPKPTAIPKPKFARTPAHPMDASQVRKRRGWRSLKCHWPSICSGRCGDGMFRCSESWTGPRIGPLPRFPLIAAC